MKLALVHHAEKKKGSEDPELTEFGQSQAVQAALFVANHMNPQHIVHTHTQRTLQTAHAFEKQFPHATRSLCGEIPETWKEWTLFVEGIIQDKQEDICIIGHHTSMQMCKKQFKIPLFLSCFSSVIIVQRMAQHEWIYSTFRQGEISL